ncbi:hypothetical protein [Nocardia fluminea]|uniref:hypothetical protein n=1 Tax=Nocardia fluminea TaxID=134984 RepID=UPI0033F04A21
MPETGAVRTSSTDSGLFASTMVNPSLMTNSRNRAQRMPSRDLASSTIVLATCVFFLLGLVALTESLTVASAGAASLGAAMTLSSKILGLNSLQFTSSHR